MISTHTVAIRAVNQNEHSQGGCAQCGVLLEKALIKAKKQNILHKKIPIYLVYRDF